VAGVPPVVQEYLVLRWGCRWTRVSTEKQGGGRNGGLPVRESREFQRSGGVVGWLLGVAAPRNAAEITRRPRSCFNAANSSERPSERSGLGSRLDGGSAANLVSELPQVAARGFGERVDSKLQGTKLHQIPEKLHVGEFNKRR
jgi:hypothetical protein